MLQAGIEDYLTDIGNWVDLVYIWGSVIMSFLHATSTPGPFHWVSKLLMIIVTILAIRRTFDFLRVFSDLSPIVTMLTNVIWDLRIFMTFYAMLTLLFSLVFGVIGLGNYNIPGKFRNKFYFIPDGGTERVIDGNSPNIEYKTVGMFFGNFIQTIRLSMGDFALTSASVHLESKENITFWFIWFLVLIITAIIFLNFIVAEASASYSLVSESLDNYI